ncbi:PREDICTED: uncharacterized protein LOC104711417 [Camelina sativa]|uniref:Uncharacterized protein LOC104711417 n=1 Tax=Camelina sativa TaxID=90675 RepID=A0ABM0THA6_CAMSA|nr:PREDICTED: uncharacterized protein LOC104711417 [Camelina sativa]
MSEGVVITEQPPETTGWWVEKTARMVAVKGPELEKLILDLNMDNNIFDFLKSSDHPCHALYQQKLAEYRSQQNNQGGGSQEPVCDAKSYLLKEIELGVIKFTALFVARYGDIFRESLMETVVMNPRFDFMKPSDSNFTLYDALVVSYSGVLKPSNNGAMVDSLVDCYFNSLQLEKLEEGVETAVIDLHAFVGGLDCFAHMDDAVSPPERLSMMMHWPMQPQLPDDASATHDCLGDAETAFAPPPIRITLKELGIIKLTSQFVARYGMRFRRALMMRVAMNPLFEFMFFRPSSKKTIRMNPPFEFMDPTEIRFNIFDVLVDAYSRVLVPSKKLKKSDACTRTVLENFSNCLQLERLEDGVEETTLIDLFAFVSGVDCFAHMDVAEYSATMPQPERLSVMMKRLTQQTQRPYMLLQLPLGSQLTNHGVGKQYECIGDTSLRAPILRSLTFRVPAMGITLKELGIIKLTAQFVARYSSEFSCALEKVPSFEFLDPSDSRFYFYLGLFNAYRKVLKSSIKLKKPDVCMLSTVLEGFHQRLRLCELQKGVEIAMVDLHAFVSGVDCFAHMEDDDYSAIMDPPERTSMMIDQLTQPDQEAQSSREQRLRRGYDFPYAFGAKITLKELGIMKFTALYVARYGMHFCHDLMKEVVMKPQFKFMEPTNSMFSLYSVIVDAYSRVLEPSDNACTKTVLEDFYLRLQLEKLEVEEEEAMIDLHAFVSGVDYFAVLEDADYSALVPPPHSQFADASMGMMPRPEEPEAKRQKLDDNTTKIV